MLAALAAALVWLTGLGVYMVRLPAVTKEPVKADAIIVLTGGPGRLEAAVSLLQAGSAPKLLITGAHARAGWRNIPALRELPPALISCCIMIERQARNTIGNAREAARYVLRERVGQALVVTADYHMPRSLMLFRQAMPGVVFYPYPVRTSVTPLAWLGEYHKFLVTALQAAFWRL